MIFRLLSGCIPLQRADKFAAFSTHLIIDLLVILLKFQGQTIDKLGRV